MSQELEPINQYAEDFEKVVNIFIKGEMNATNIAKETGIRRALVVEYLSNWKQIAQNDKGIRARGREALTEMDRHYSMIIKNMWELVDDPSVDARTTSTTLKAIADVEAKRQEVLQRAGLYDDAGVADELIDMEEKATAIKKLLTEVAKRWPETTTFIMEGLNEVFQTPTTIEGETG